MTRSYLVTAALALFCFAMMPAAAHAAMCGVAIPPCDPNAIGSACYKPKKPCPKCKPKECDKCTKSPGYVGIGSYETAATDTSIPTAGGFPLEIVRTYDSTHQFDGPLGYGWVSGFESRLFHASYLYAAPDVYVHEVDVVLPDTEHFKFTDNGNGVYTPEPGRYDKLARNADGSWDLTLQRSRSVLHFDEQGLLTSMKDDFGNEIVVTHDSAGRVERVADAAGSGRYLDVFWGAAGRISHIADHTGRQVGFDYDGRGVLTTVTDPAGRQASYSYAPGRLAPLLSQIRDHWSRVITDVTWDARDRVTSYTEAGELHSYSYGSDSMTTKTDSAGNVWTYPYTADGLVTEDRLPGGARRYTSFYADGAVQQATDEVGVKTYYTYDARGNITTATKDHQGPSAVRWDYTYDPSFPDQVASIVAKNPTTGAPDSNWQSSRFEYCQEGSPAPGALRKTFRIRSDGVTEDVLVEYVYDAMGRAIKAIDPAGAESEYAYDAAGNLWTDKAPSNNDAGTRPVTTYAYDALARVTTVTDPLGHATTYTYDALDRITTVTLPKPSSGSPLDFTTTYAYDLYDPGTGLVSVHVTDANGNVTRQAYDQFGRLRTSTDALGSMTSYGYTRDLLTSLTDANDNVTRYEYDALKRLSATVFPNDARETYAYWPDGLLRTKTDRKSQTITYEYDRFKRLKKKIYPDATFIEYTYQGQKLTQVSDMSTSPAETHTFAYDPAFRMTSNTQGPRGTIGYTYTPSDAVASYTVAGGPTASYSYYPDGSLSTIEWTPVTGTFKYTYTPNRQYQRVTLPSGQTREYAYDDQGRLTLLANRHPTAGNLATYGYAYDINHHNGQPTMKGQRVTMVADVPALGLTSGTTRYFYDSGYRLVRVEYPNTVTFAGQVHEWTYDSVGNRLSSAVDSLSTPYVYDAVPGNQKYWRRLKTMGTEQRGSDANGNVTAFRSFGMSWDFDNRLTGLTGTGEHGFRYDYESRRTQMSGASATSFLFDGDNVIALDVDRFQLFGLGLDEILATASALGASFPVVDDVNSVAGWVNTTGVNNASFSQFDAWGVPSTSMAPDARGFTGRESVVQGVWFHRFRYYDAISGMFLSEDPLGTRQGVSQQSFARQNPIGRTDPLGLYAVDPKCTQPPFQGLGVAQAVGELCLSKMKPGSKCSKVLKDLGNAMWGDDGKYLNCVKKKCQSKKFGIKCDEKCEPCGTYQSPNQFLTLGPPGKSMCPATPPNLGNKYQGKPNGDPIGAGETLFHETLHACGITPPQDHSGPLGKAMKYASWKCYGWKGLN